jgi:hypothetical protein
MPKFPPSVFVALTLTAPGLRVQQAELWVHERKLLRNPTVMGDKLGVVR